MTAEQSPQLSPSTPEFRVTYRPTTQEFEIAPESVLVPGVNYPGDPALLAEGMSVPEELTVYRSLTPHNTGRMFEALSSLYVALGPGHHPKKTVTETTDQEWSGVRETMNLAQGVLPGQVAGMHNPDCKCCKYIFFGNMALATALTDISAEEKQRRNELFHAKAAAQPTFDAPCAEVRLPQMRAECLAAEADKQQLLTFSHAILQFGSDIRYIRFDTLENILLLRFIRSARQTQTIPSDRASTHRVMAFTSVRNHVWESMSIAERKLLTDDPFVLYGDSSQILTNPLRHVWHAFGKMLIDDRLLLVHDRYHVIFDEAPITIRYLRVPPKQPYRNFRELRMSPFNRKSKK